MAPDSAVGQPDLEYVGLVVDVGDGAALAVADTEAGALSLSTRWSPTVNGPPGS